MSGTEPTCPRDPRAASVPPPPMSTWRLSGIAFFSLADEEDIPVLGVAAAGDLESEPSGSRPSDVLPDARSLLCFGLAVPAGVYDTDAHQTETVWRTQNIYYRRLDTLSLRFAALLEESGERAIPVFGCLPMGLNAEREVYGFVNQLRMGEAAGIGIIGRNGLLLHERYGSRLMLGGVVTTAALPAMRRGEALGRDVPPIAGSASTPALSEQYRWANRESRSTDA